MAKKDFMAAFLREREQSEAVSKLDTEVTMVPVSNVTGNWKNFYNVDDLDDLMASIRIRGVLDPINITDHHTVISGHRRLAACKRLFEETGDEKFKMIPCIIRHPEDDVEEEMMLIEANSTARVLTSFELMEQAKRYDALLVKAKDQGYEYEGRRRDIVAKMMKVGPAKVGRYAAIDKHLNENWKFLFQQGEVSESVAYEISKMDMDAQESVLGIFLDDDGHVNVTLAEVQQFAADMQKVNEEPDIEPELKELPEQGYTLCTPEGEPEIVGLPPRKYESEKTVQHDIVPDPDPDPATEHEETLDKWRKMAEQQEDAEAPAPARETEPEQTSSSCGQALDQLDELIAAVPNTGGESSPYDYIGQRFKLLREEKNFTRREMADYLGWFNGTYSAIENGDACSLDRLCDAAKKLGVSLDWLVGFSDNRTGGISVRNGRDRLTHERCSGMKSGYWSPAKKDELIDRLAEYENAEDSNG